MLRVMEHLKDILNNDEVIIQYVNEYEGEPCIAYQVAPSDMPLPYIVINVGTNNGEGNLAVDRMLYNVDVYTDNGDIVTASLLADRVDFLFNRRKLPSDIGIGIWKEIKTPVTNEEDLAVQHFHLSFIVRHNSIY